MRMRVLGFSLRVMCRCENASPQYSWKERLAKRLKPLLLCRKTHVWCRLPVPAANDKLLSVHIPLGLRPWRNLGSPETAR